MKNEIKSLLPLSPAALHILLALAGEDRHGYGIMRETLRQSQGHYKLGPGTLYDNLDKLMHRGLVADAPRRAKSGDPRGHYYRLAEFGRRVLSADLERLRAVVTASGLKLSEPQAREPRGGTILT